MITRSIFDKIEHGKVFFSASGLLPQLSDDPVRLLAIKGHGNDWAIYYHTANLPDSMVLSNGMKVTFIETVKSIISCSEEVYKLYRF